MASRGKARNTTVKNGKIIERYSGGRRWKQ
jgi:hypothetical protein